MNFNALEHVKLLDVMGNDEDIANAARVSYGKGTRSVSDNRTLIRYLIRHKHSSPTEMAEMKFYIKCPMFVARQMFRHRTFSANEISARYSEVKNEYYTPEAWNKQSVSNKQGSGEPVERSKNIALTNEYEERCSNTFNRYEELLADDIAREQARIMLPQSTYTEFIWKANLRNILHFLGLRMESNAQHEIRQYANTIAGIVAEKFPITFEAWMDYEYNAVKFSAQECFVLADIIAENPLLLNTDLARYGITNKREQTEFYNKIKRIVEMY